MYGLPAEAQKKLQELREKFNEIPVPVIAIAKELGIKIYEASDFSRTQSGSIKKEKGRYVIYLNGLDHPTRKRFTIAHEIGHFLLHRDYLNQGNEAITEIKQPVTELNRPADPTPMNEAERKREIEANRFAAELLMPSEEFKEAFKQANNVEDIADKFYVSSSAVAVRAKDLLGYIII